MSHLDHLVRVKLKLTSMGITCPKAQANILNNAYINAIIADLFTRNKSFCISNDDRWRYENKLDCWNSVSPLNYKLIQSTWVQQVNALAGELQTTGQGCIPPAKATSPEGEFDLCSLVEYNDLVGWLRTELRNCDE